MAWIGPVGLPVGEPRGSSRVSSNSWLGVSGGSLFSGTDKDKQLLTLVESESFGNGIQKLVYDVAH